MPEDQPTSKPSAIYNFLIGALAYSAIGLGAGVLWSVASVGFGIPSITLWAFLALWWVWMLVWLPPIVVFISVFRATDPIAQLAKNITPPEKS